LTQKATEAKCAEVKGVPVVAMARAADAGRCLGKRLTAGHDRKLVAQNMQRKMMDVLESSV